MSRAPETGRSREEVLAEGAHYFWITPVYAPVREVFRIDVDWVADHVTPNTIALFGSAGNYPHGPIDDIPALGPILPAGAQTARAQTRSDTHRSAGPRMPVRLIRKCAGEDQSASKP